MGSRNDGHPTPTRAVAPRRARLATVRRSSGASRAVFREDEKEGASWRWMPQTVHVAGHRIGAPGSESVSLGLGQLPDRSIYGPSVLLRPSLALGARREIRHRRIEALSRHAGLRRVARMLPSFRLRNGAGEFPVAKKAHIYEWAGGLP